MKAKKADRQSARAARPSSPPRPDPDEIRRAFAARCLAEAEAALARLRLPAQAWHAIEVDVIVGPRGPRVAYEITVPGRAAFERSTSRARRRLDAALEARLAHIALHGSRGAERDGAALLLRRRRERRRLRAKERERLDAQHQQRRAASRAAGAQRTASAEQRGRTLVEEHRRELEAFRAQHPDEPLSALVKYWRRLERLEPEVRALSRKTLRRYLTKYL
jgi:hypothetical protein